MLKALEKNTVLQVLVLLALIIILWSGALIHPVAMAPSESYGPLYDVLLGLGLPPRMGVTLAILLVLGGGLSLNWVLTRANLVSQNSLLPTMLYVIFMSAKATTLTPTLIVGVVDIAFISMLMLHGTLLTIPSSKICGAAVVMGICSLFYLPALTLVLTYLLVSISYRLYGWREWIIMLLGLLAPWIALWIVLFMTDGLTAGWQAMCNGLGIVSGIVGSVNTLPAISNLLLTVVLAVSLIGLWRRLGEKPVVWQKNASTVMLPTITGIAMLFYTRLFPVNLEFFALPFALAGTHLLMPERRRSLRSKGKWKEHIGDAIFILIITAAALC